MSNFNDWARRHLANDPQEPASPPPFTVEDRVAVQAPAVDGGFSIHGVGVVASVDYITDPEDPYGPWAVSVIFDGTTRPMLFNSSEITPDAHTRAEDFEPYTGQGEVPALPKRLAAMGGTPSREQLPESPIYDQVREEALAVDGFADQVERDLKALTEGDAR
jgi:hypothetical protein